MSTTGYSNPSAWLNHIELLGLLELSIYLLTSMILRLTRRPSRKSLVVWAEPRP